MSCVSSQVDWSLGCGKGKVDPFAAKDSMSVDLVEPMLSKPRAAKVESRREGLDDQEGASEEIFSS